MSLADQLAANKANQTAVSTESQTASGSVVVDNATGEVVKPDGQSTTVPNPVVTQAAADELIKPEAPDLSALQDKVKEVVVEKEEALVNKEDINLDAAQALADEAPVQYDTSFGNISTGAINSLTGIEEGLSSVEDLLRATNKTFDDPNAKVQHGILPTVAPQNLPSGYYTVHKGAKGLPQIGGRFYWAAQGLSDEDVAALEDLVERGMAEKV